MPTGLLHMIFGMHFKFNCGICVTTIIMIVNGDKSIFKNLLIWFLSIITRQRQGKSKYSISIAFTN